MNLTTPVAIEPLQRRLDYSDKYLFMGSCFADSIGGIMAESGFDVTVNPFGVLYNPASIAQSFNRMDSREPFTCADVICNEGLYTSFWHHSRFSRPSQEEFLNDANGALTAAADAFAAAGVCVVTLGTSWVFRHLGRDMIVSNCHKIVASQFRRERLSVEQSAAFLAPVVERHPEKEWIFTVSPIRHTADGAHGNQISKASLLLAIDALQDRFANVHYFPAYEIMMDELRDYRFYEENMTHPSHLAVEHIFECFRQFALDEDCSEKIRLARKQARAALHRKFQFGNTALNE
ncbi:MAG: GSCFA domain-containing protein [Bacteroidales bacterium]|nr:GSCFA domain-containing protein [Bacteroidales bacterium]